MSTSGVAARAGWPVAGGEGWVGASAREIARAVRRGDVSATQVLADHLDHIRLRDSELCAFRLLREGEAAAEAEQVDAQEDLSGAALAGVPVAVKENTAVAGLPTWFGSAAVRAPVAEADHEVVRRLRGAGAVVVGTTRMPELGLWATTDGDSGVTRNPWDLDRSPGGSSGGAAAAVAAGLVPIAHGTDGFGSLRIPAACCGLVALKAGRGVLPSVPEENFLGIVEHGLLTSTVADAATGFAVLAGLQPGRLEEPSRLRIAVSLRAPVTGVRLDQDNRQAVATAARLLVAAGHDAVRAEVPYPAWLRLRGMAIWLAAAHHAVAGSGAAREALQPRTRRHAALGQLAWQRGMARESDPQRWRDESLAFLDSYDVVLTPALAGPPPAARQWSAASWQANVTASVRYAPYGAPWNIAGLPAIVVPVGQRADGLPVAAQLVGRPGSEKLLLALAGQIEQAAPALTAPPSSPPSAPIKD